jgi:hypothetical protein
LEGLYRKRFDYLLDWDMACFDWSVRVLGLEIQAGLTERWVREYSSEEAVDWRGELRPKDRGMGMGPGGQGGEGGDAGAVGAAAETLPYRQVFEERTGFIPNLSILDLLFCEGKNAIRYIRSS